MSEQASPKLPNDAEAAAAEASSTPDPANAPSAAVEGEGVGEQIGDTNESWSSEDDLPESPSPNREVEMAHPEAARIVPALEKEIVQNEHVVWMSKQLRNGFRLLDDRLSMIEARQGSRWAEAWKGLAIVSTTAWLLLMALVGLPPIRAELAKALLDERQAHALELVTTILERRPDRAFEEADDAPR